MKLNLGCGDKIWEGYTNIDLYNPKADVKADVSKLPFEEAFASEIQAIAIFEHISPYQVFNTLLEWKRVLKTEGLLAIELPDMKATCDEYSKQNMDQRVHLLKCIYGQYTPASPHLFGWDEELLRDILYRAGFRKIRRTPPLHGHWGYMFRMECIK